MFHAAYRRKVFETVGGFNEHLARTEDNEMHYRMRKAGFKLCFDPDIVSYQHTRSSLKGMLKQKYANGYWIGLTSGVCPQCLSIYHFVPFAFVLAIILSALLCGCLSIAGAAAVYKIISVLTGFMWALYWLLAVVMALAAELGSSENRNYTGIVLPLLFFLLHVSYGLGTVAGLIKMPVWVKGIKDGRNEKR
jgi:GT2 family glycosyltransferase